MRGIFPRLNNSSLAIISIWLKSINKDRDPSSLVHRYLKPYFPGDNGSLKLVNMSFSIQPKDPSSLEQHQKALNGVAKKLRK
jgi:hypothetical protein